MRTLRGKGVRLIFGVDATCLHKCKELKGNKFNKIYFGFPHLGKALELIKISLTRKQDLESRIRIGTL